MLDRMQVGDVPRKHHIQLRGGDGALRYEECFTRDGFDGPYTILYHLRRPHLQRVAPARHGWAGPEAAPEVALAKRHYRTGELAPRGGPQIDARVALLFNPDLACGVDTIDEPIDDLRALEVLVDGDQHCEYMLQIFLKEASGLYGDPKAGPFFYEIIQRKGDRGFGAGNFRALFESIERDQRERGVIP